MEFKYVKMLVTTQVEHVEGEIYLVTDLLANELVKENYAELYDGKTVVSTDKDE